MVHRTIRTARVSPAALITTSSRAFRGRGQEAAAQAVPAVGRRIEADPAGVALHDPRRAVVRQGVARHPSAPRHRSEHGPAADLRQPRLHRLDRPELLATGNRDLLPCPS